MPPAVPGGPVPPMAEAGIAAMPMPFAAAAGVAQPVADVAVPVAAQAPGMPMPAHAAMMPPRARKYLLHSYTVVVEALEEVGLGSIS